MKKLLFIALFAFGAHAHAVTAYFTGKSYQAQTVTYQMAWVCEYRYAGKTFTQVQTGNIGFTCPYSVEVY